MDDPKYDYLNGPSLLDDEELRDALDYVEKVRQKENSVPLEVLARAYTPKKRPLAAFILYAGDPISEIARKLLLVVSLLVFVGTASILINESVIIPKQNATLAEELTDIRYSGHSSQLTEEANRWDGFPSEIQDDLKTLYYLNTDIRGWLKYGACNVDREVMYGGDNDYYLTHDFYRNQNKNGALFFDANNRLDTATSQNKSLVIYGHNMASGQMFAKLNDLAASLDTMKNRNQIITLDTLFTTTQYKIFAVVLQDSKADPTHYFSIQETSFTNNNEFLKYVDGLRTHSLYDFPDVDVTASDELLILYTCTPKSIAHFDDARLAVVARKVRAGESPTVSSTNIVKNKDVIMPYRWYTAQKKTPHSYYGTATTSTTTTNKSTTTAATKATTKAETTTAKTTTTTP